LFKISLNKNVYIFGYNFSYSSIGAAAYCSLQILKFGENIDIKVWQLELVNHGKINFSFLPCKLLVRRESKQKNMFVMGERLQE